VIYVSWEDAVAYAQWLSEQTGKRYRLPTEAEWEYAARAGTRTPWSFGDDKGELGNSAWYSANSGAQTHPVGEKAPNPWGLHDVHGNVWEWVRDCWHGSYARAPTDGSAWEEADGGDCGRRVLRGGSWFDGPVTLRSAYRFRNLAVYVLGFFHGFRLAQDL
jgi:formylglycine-generating enzyme required for sulfatase activity